jgi:hypothetical protein
MYNVVKHDNVPIANDWINIYQKYQRRLSNNSLVDIYKMPHTYLTSYVYFVPLTFQNK